MLSISDAIVIYLEKVPNKKITGIGEWKNLYVIGGCNKNLPDNVPDLDPNYELIDKNTGELSTINILTNADLIENLKELLNEEQVEELISSLTFDK